MSRGLHWLDLLAILGGGLLLALALFAVIKGKRPPPR
jgi:hypothetical protein